MKKGLVSALVGVFVTVFGLIFVLVGTLVWRGQQKDREQCTVELTAVVAGNIRSSDGDAVHPVFEYEYEGRKYSVQSSYGSSPPAYEVGERVQIFIDPDDPQRYYAPGEKAPKIVFIVFTAVGGAAALAGVIILITGIVSAVKNGGGSDGSPEAELVEYREFNNGYDEYNGEDEYDDSPDYDEYDDLKKGKRR